MRRQGMMSLDECRSVIDEVAPWAYEIVFYNRGEPLLNRHIFEMVRYARKKNLPTSLSRNLTVLRDDALDTATHQPDQRPGATKTTIKVVNT
jgi:MoaA/NifB/PqqE/SkfB family radical SAM enzyme